MNKRTQLVRRLLPPWLYFLLSLFAGASVADQNHPELDQLFDSLKQAPSNSTAREVENQIWLAWLEAPDVNSGLLMSQITNAMSAGQLEFALRLCDQLIDSNPTFAEAWNKRATIQYLVGEHGKSVADIKQTLVLEPRHFGALSGLGLIFMSSGNYEAALDAFSAVLDISPSSDNARGSIARVESLIGEDI